jgi:hypothetical protein
LLYTSLMKIDMKKVEYFREDRDKSQLETKLLDFISDKLHWAYWDAKYGRGLKFVKGIKLIRESIMDQLKKMYFHPKVEDPLKNVHKVCRRYRLHYCHYYLDMPLRLTFPGYTAVVRGKGGIVVHKEKVKSYQQQLPLPVLPQAYPPKPPGHVFSEGEKRERALKFLSLYASEGYIHPAAKAVGVDYITLLSWINSDEFLQDVATLANQSVQQLMEDVARYRAIHGSDSLMKFFLEHENVKFMSESTRKTRAGEKAIESQDKVMAILAQAEENSKVLDVAAEVTSTVNLPDAVSKLLNEHSEDSNEQSQG